MFSIKMICCTHTKLHFCITPTEFFFLTVIKGPGKKRSDIKLSGPSLLMSIRFKIVDHMNIISTSLVCLYVRHRIGLRSFSYPLKNQTKYLRSALLPVF